MKMEKGINLKSNIKEHIKTMSSINPLLESSSDIVIKLGLKYFFVQIYQKVYKFPTLTIIVLHTFGPSFIQTMVNKLDHFAGILIAY